MNIKHGDLVKWYQKNREARFKKWLRANGHDWLADRIENGPALGTHEDEDPTSFDEVARLEREFAETL